MKCILVSPQHWKITLLSSQITHKNKEPFMMAAFCRAHINGFWLSLSGPKLNSTELLRIKGSD